MTVDTDRVTSHHNNGMNTVVYTTDIVQIQIIIHPDIGMDGRVIVCQECCFIHVIMIN